MRTSPRALGALLLTACLAVGLSACGSSGSSGSSDTTTPAGASGTIASGLVLGGPPECPTRPSCLVGLTDVYGARFREFVALDAGGPSTHRALTAGDVDVALVRNL